MEQEDTGSYRCVLQEAEGDTVLDRALVDVVYRAAVCFSTSWVSCRSSLASADPFLPLTLTLTLSRATCAARWTRVARDRRQCRRRAHTATQGARGVRRQRRPCRGCPTRRA